ncbi:MAG: hypothetical protein IPJ04_00850 [Candidatus Eisenbacteria bacterium]|nr:hypothetical protein [Candidatus Eisenbacteria bacterium]
MPKYQGGLSVYDEWHASSPTASVRSSRWGYYGMTHTGPVALLGEIAAGTDQNETESGITRRNLLAYWAEADWAPHRQYNLRVRYDHAEMDRSSDDLSRDLNSYNRYAIEGEYVPLPFAEIRWTFRLIDPVAEKDAFDTKIPNEKQGYIQFHFSY